MYTTLFLLLSCTQSAHKLKAICVFPTPAGPAISVRPRGKESRGFCKKQSSCGGEDDDEMLLVPPYRSSFLWNSPRFRFVPIRKSSRAETGSTAAPLLLDTAFIPSTGCRVKYGGIGPVLERINPCTDNRLEQTFRPPTAEKRRLQTSPR